MNNDDNLLNPNWAVGTSTFGDHGNNGDAFMNELKSENIALKAKLQVLENENKQLVEEKKIQEDKWSKLEKEMREKLLKRKLQESQDEFASLDEKCQKKIAELEMKNEKLTEENKAYEEKLKKLEEMVQMNEQKINDTENEIMVPIHEMKVQLPLENWHDLLAFVRRSQLGNVVSQIGDRQFAYIIQSFLHDEAREITLGDMRIIRPRPFCNIYQTMVFGRSGQTNMPDFPMPGNIKDFREFCLNYVDMSVLNFLGKFQQNSLLENVNMCFDYTLRRFEDLPHVLTKIAPYITSIDSIASPEVDLFRMVYNNNDGKNNNESKLLLKEMMAKTRILWADWDAYDDEFESWEDKMDWCFSWLYTPKDDGKPRMLISYEKFHKSTDCAYFIERIKKDFKMANNPISFFIYTRIDKDYNVEDISLENVKTNEKLVIKTKSVDPWKMLMISRHPLKAPNYWIEANEQEIFDWDPEKLNRRINMDGEMTIAI